MKTDTLDLNLRIDPSVRVDAKSKTLHDLAIMTGGREASGHGIFIDQKTIDTGFAAIASEGGQLRAAIKHPSLLDQINGKRDRVLDMPGFFSDIRVDGNKLVAGKFEFFDSFQQTNAPAVDRILEMAAKAPKLFGLSAEISGDLVFVDTAGNEFAAKRDSAGKWSGAPEGVQLANGGMPTLRISHLGVAAFVDRPAANDGLFAKLSQFFGGKKNDLAFVGDLARAFLEWEQTGALHSSATSNGVTANLTQSKDDPMKQTYDAIKAKFGADKAKFSQAMTLLGEQPEITFEALLGKMAEIELGGLRQQVTDLTAQVGTLTTERTNLSAQIATLTGERDSYKTKFEQLKSSGVLGGDLNLGIGQGSGSQINPWAKDTLNYTLQAEISNRDPKLAEQLKTAAGK